MSQQVLARKWRPTTFESLIGQNHVRKALRHALENQRLHHAYLFTGTRGVGKTTIARILARCLNCETGITANPCGNCVNCSSISQNRFMDLLEVDAASRTKVDDTRQLLENVSYAPGQGRYKVYLIDEVHMLSTHSFNALLKTLEEPPDHVVFLLATTDPQKLPPTVLSRCLQFHLRDISPDLVADHLKNLLHKELIDFEEDALWHIAKAGRGSVRDAITLLDQAIAHGQGQVRVDDVIQMLGTQGFSELPLMLSFISKGDSNEVLKLIQRLSELTPDWMSLVSGLQSLIHQVSVCQVATTSIHHLSPSEQKAVTELAEVMAPEFLQLAYQFALTGYRDLPLSTDPRSAFEMLILRMIAFRPARNGESVSSTKIESEPGDPEPSSLGSEFDVAENDLRTTELHQAQSLPICEESVREPEIVDSFSGESSGLEIIKPVTNTHVEPKNLSAEACSLNMSESERYPLVKEANRTSASGNASMNFEDIGATDDTGRLNELSVDNWVSQSHQLGLRGLTGSLLNQMALIRLNKTEVCLAASAHTIDLLTEVHRKRIVEAFDQVYGIRLSLMTETRDILPETPEAHTLRMKNAALQSARDSFQNDSFVKHLKQAYNAEVSLQSIEPRES